VSVLVGHGGLGVGHITGGAGEGMALGVGVRYVRSVLADLWRVRESMGCFYVVN
jgi:hypothetical protein